MVGNDVFVGDKVKNILPIVGGALTERMSQLLSLLVTLIYWALSHFGDTIHVRMWVMIKRQDLYVRRCIVADDIKNDVELVFRNVGLQCNIDSKIL